MKGVDFSGLVDIPIIDCHTHFTDINRLDELLKTMYRGGIDRLNILCISNLEAPNPHPQAIYAKAQKPDRIYIFGALNYSGLLESPSAVKGSDLAAQVDILVEIGFDGIKMEEGKPTMYGKIPFRFDGSVYADFFARMEERKFPLLWHVNDPKEFWDAEKFPKWVGREWFYGDNSYPNREEIYTEVNHVLERYPGLRIVFAHFYFLADDLKQAGQLLDCYPEVNLDLAPAILAYHKFSAHPQAARGFFLKYQDRILYGTDLGIPPIAPGLGNLERIWMVRNFLESEDLFHYPGGPEGLPPLQGLGLPTEALHKIYHRNFERLVGEHPAPLDMERAHAECERIAALNEPEGEETQAREVMTRLGGG